MRWAFLLPPRSEDVELGALRHAAIERWWEVFALSAPELPAAPAAAARLLDRNLAAVHPELSWVVVPARGAGGHALTITAPARKELRPLVSAILARAPRLRGWEFYPYRPPDPAALWDLLAPRGWRPEELAASVRRGEGNRIDLHFAAARTTSASELLALAPEVCQLLLGEELCEHWLGVLEIEEEPSAALALGELAEAFRAVRELVLAGLPELPRCELVADCEWTSYKLEPRREADYPRRRDVIAGITADYDLVRTLQAELPFSSLRFSRQGEVFAYLKLSKGAVPDRELAEWREQLARELNARLGPFGGCVGGATGYRYCYLDLALCDVAAALPIIRATAQETEVPLRSWLLFCDDVWRQEWVGLWDETPPPPVAADA